MPVTMPHNLPGDNPRWEPSSGCLDIGLVNNMPDAALQSTERQFLALLDKAANGIPVRVWRYTLPDVPRSASVWSRIQTHYQDIESLWDSHLDALIVTGTEPRASDLRKEPYWAGLTKLIDWAERRTLSSIWSCLAAHAAVLHLDGVGRRRLGAKRSGIYECARLSNHRLMDGVPGRFRMPHSRWNDISPAELIASGYVLLARDENQEADVFVKQGHSTMVFFQGHPEYESDTLFREYRRDVRRFLNRESETYPMIPDGYVSAHTAKILAGLQERAMSNRSEGLFAEFPADPADHGLLNTWRSPANRIYANWLKHVSVLKERREVQPSLHTMAACGAAAAQSQQLSPLA